MRNSHARRFGLLLPLALITAITVLASGCLVTSNTTTEHSGNYVPDSTFDQIVPGKTTAAWVRTTMGPASSVDQVDDSQIWRYSYTQRKDSSGAVFLVFGGHSETETQHTAFVQIKDGIVVKAWRT